LAEFEAKFSFDFKLMCVGTMQSLNSYGRLQVRVVSNHNFQDCRCRLQPLARSTTHMPYKPTTLKSRVTTSRTLGLYCIAHGDHGDHKSHRHNHSHKSCCGSHGDSDTHHRHHNETSTNIVHTVLNKVFTTTGISKLAAWLEDSIPSTIAKIFFLTIAAITAYIATTTTTTSSTSAIITANVHNNNFLVANAGLISKITASIVYFFAGIPAAIDLLYDVSSAKVDTHVLMNLAVVGSLVTGHPLEGALLLVLFQTSHVVEHVLTAKAQGSLTALYDTAPQHATIVSLDSAQQQPDMSSTKQYKVDQVQVGDLMLVKAGEIIPLDGVIVTGRALISSEHITGESIPVLRKPGDELAAGSLNRDGLLVIKAVRPAEDSTPARIAELALQAQADRPQLKSFLDTFGERYSKAVIVATLCSLAVMLSMGVPFLSSASERGALYRAMGLLTVASPCALVMTPLTYVSAIAAMAGRGVVLRGGRVLDALASVRSVAFDKTGTLTSGTLVCSSMGSLGGGEASGRRRRAAVAAAAALSLRSSHPVADAVVLLASQQGIDLNSVGVDGFRLVAGGGVEAEALTLPPLEAFASVLGSESYDSLSASQDDNSSNCNTAVTAMFGSVEYVRPKLRTDEAAALDKMLTKVKRNTGAISVLVLEGHREHSVWTFSFEDSVRDQSAAAVKQLQTGSWLSLSSYNKKKSSNRRWRRSSSYNVADQIDVIMLTGDNEVSAQRVADRLGITSVHSSLTPEQKVDYIQNLRNKGGVVMVGDGLNDAAALATATVGVAIASTGSAAASLAADAIVMNASGIAAVPLLLHMARVTQRVVRQNLALAIGSIAVLVLPTVLGFVPLWLAVAAHEGSTLAVALNSLRLLRMGKWWPYSSSSALLGDGSHVARIGNDEVAGTIGPVLGVLT